MFIYLKYQLLLIQYIFGKITLYKNKYYYMKIYNIKYIISIKFNLFWQQSLLYINELYEEQPRSRLSETQGQLTIVETEILQTQLIFKKIKCMVLLL